MEKKNLFITLVFTLLLLVTTYPATYFVDNARPDDTGSGLSWTEAKKNYFGCN